MSRIIIYVWVTYNATTSYDVPTEVSRSFWPLVVLLVLGGCLAGASSVGHILLTEIAAVNDRRHVRRNFQFPNLLHMSKQPTTRKSRDWKLPHDQSCREVCRRKITAT